MESRIIETNAGPVEYTLQGEGETVLLIHGGNGNCHANFRHERLLGNGNRVLAPSRPGYGRTPITAGKTAAEQAEMLAGLLSALNINDAALIASSAGGPTALEFARRYPDRTRCLILEEAITTTWVPVYFPQYWAMKWFMHPKRQGKIWQDQRKHFENDQKTYLISLAKLFSLCDPEEVVRQWDGEDIEYYRQMLYGFDSGPGFIHTMDHKAGSLREIHVPVLIMHTVHDKNVPFHHALHAHRLIKGSELFVLPSLSHIIYMGKGKELVIEKRMAFLDMHHGKSNGK